MKLENLYVQGNKERSEEIKKAMKALGNDNNVSYDPDLFYSLGAPICWTLWDLRGLNEPKIIINVDQLKALVKGIPVPSEINPVRMININNGSVYDFTTETIGKLIIKGSSSFHDEGDTADSLIPYWREDVWKLHSEQPKEKKEALPEENKTNEYVVALSFSKNEGSYTSQNIEMVHVKAGNHDEALGFALKTKWKGGNHLTHYASICVKENL